MTMNRLLTSAVLLGALSTPAQALGIRIDLSDLDIQVGETFVVSIVAEDLFGDHANQELLAYGFDLDWDPSIAGLITPAAVAAGFLEDSLLTGLDVSASTFPGLADPGGSLDLTLAQLSFEALAPGSFDLNVSTDPLNPFAGLFFSDLAVDSVAGTTRVAVNDQVTVPVPGTLALLAMGVVPLLRLRRS